jgi:hypothetical protein
MYIASHISQVLLFGAANRLGGLKLTRLTTLD